MALVSIIIPVYNVKKYLPRCIESVLAQTLGDFEALLVDDGSTDGSGALCDEYVRTDSRIQVFHQENGGLSSARNTGLQYARGDYITFVDSDDFLHPDFLMELVTLIRDTGAQVSVCRYLPVEEGQKPSMESSEPAAPAVCLSGTQAAEKIVLESQRFMITAWGKLYSAGLAPWLRFPPGRLHEDEFVTYKVFFQAQKVAVSLKQYYYYLQRGGSIIRQSFREKRLDKLDALREAVSYFEQRGESRLSRAAKKRYLLNVQIAWYRVYTGMENSRELQKRLQREHREFYRENRRDIKELCSLTDRAAIAVFRLWPRLYCLFAAAYLKFVPED